VRLEREPAACVQQVGPFVRSCGHTASL
jgi:hypothetical protein